MDKLLDHHYKAMSAISVINDGKLKPKIIGRMDAAGECSKISIQFAIDELKMFEDCHALNGNWTTINTRIQELQKQISKF